MHQFQMKSPTSQPAIFQLLSGMAVIAILYFGRDVLLPFAMSILLTFLLAPLVNRLERCRIPRVPAVLIVVAASFAAIGLLGYVLLHQMYDLAYRLPEYGENITHKAQILKGDRDGILAKISRAFQDVGNVLVDKPVLLDQPTGAKEASRPRSAEDSVANGGRILADRVKPLNSSGEDENASPVYVQVVSPLSAASFLEQVMAIGPTLAPIGMGVMVVVFGIFMLIEREDLRNRLIYLIGSHHLNNTTLALDSAALRLSRYLRMQLIVNTVFGVWVAVGLLFAGIPNPLLWGFAAILLRFIPYVGPVVAAIVPLAISLAIFDGWRSPVAVIALYGVGEMLVGNLLEPRLISSSTGISALGVLVSAVFWMWIWGPVGLILSMPLTVCLAVLCSYVPRLAFLNALLSHDHVLPPAARFYQRLLAADLDEAQGVAEEYLQHGTLESLYDVVLVPALGLAEQDRHRGDLDEGKRRFIIEAIRELIEELGSHHDAPDGGAPSDSTADGIDATAPEQIPFALCLPACDEADEIVGLMLAQLLERRRVSMRVLSTTHLASEMVSFAEQNGIDVICVSALPPFAASHARYLCKKLVSASDHLKVVVGLWQSDAKKAQDRLNETGIESCVTTLAQASEQLANLAFSAKLLQRAH